MAKTPYEIRLELLRLASEQITYDYNNKYNEYNLKYEKGCPPKDNARPEYPSTDEIIKSAEQLNKFVTDGDRKTFYIDVGNMPESKIQAAIAEVAATFKDTKIKITEA